MEIIRRKDVADAQLKRLKGHMRSVGGRRNLALLSANTC